MSYQKIPTDARDDKKNKYVEEALKLIEDNYISTTEYREAIKKGQKLLKDIFIVEAPSGLRRVEGGLMFQVGESILRKLQVPSATYSVQADDLSSSSYIANIIRDGVETVMELGGFEESMMSKQGVFFNAVYYGDGHIRLGSDPTGRVPIRFGVVNPDQVNVDSSATQTHSSTGGKKVTRMVLVYPYDYDQAKENYPKAKFGLGDIPNQTDTSKDFNKTYTQDTESDLRKVEVAHSFSVGKDPCYTEFAGSNCTLLSRPQTGDNYPFIDGRTDEPYIPVDRFSLIPSFEGYFNYGLVHLLYKYHITKRVLFNKATMQSINSMSDTVVINSPRSKEQEMLSRINNARKMAQNGETGIIINDSNEPVTVTKLQADMYEQGLRLLDEWYDREIKRFGFNIDAIREQKSTTATQILAESAVEDEVIAYYIDRNTEFFKRMHYWTMDAILANVAVNDKTPIWTNTRIPVEGKIDALTGAPVMTNLIITFGELKRLIKKYRKGLYVEIDTKTGVKEKDNIKTARALVALRTSQLPAVQTEALKILMQANNIPVDISALTQQVQQTPQAGVPSQAGAMVGEIMKAEQQMP